MRTGIMAAMVMVLSWPVWGWALEPGGSIQIKKVERCVTFTKDGTTGITCAQDFTGCYQQMREAMARMDAMHQITLGEWALNKELQKKAGRAGMELWNQTMKDCVEGGK